METAFYFAKKIATRCLYWAFPSYCLSCGLSCGLNSTTNHQNSQPPQTSALSHNICLCSACAARLTTLGKHCQLCAEPLSHGDVCGHCLSQPPPFSEIFAPYIYAPPLDQLIVQLKHSANLPASQVLGQLLANAVSQQISRQYLKKPDCLLAMPLHWRRRWQRGFNQSYQIAKIVARHTAIPLHTTLAKRVQHTPMQQHLSRKAREANLRNSFVASKSCKGLHIAVIDDVVTTTSTSRAIAKALLKGGAKRVDIWCIARTALDN